MSDQDAAALDEAGTPAADEAAQAALEPQTDETADTAQASAESSHLYAGRYATPDALERAYTEAQQTISRQGDELGQYRRAQATPKADAEAEAEAPVTLPELTPAEQRALIPAAQRMMQIKIQRGWSEEEAQQDAWQEVYGQAQVSKHIAAAMIDPLRQESAQSSYGPVATQAASAVRGVEAAEIDTELRRLIPPQQWAGLPSEVRAGSAEMVAKMLAYDRLTATPAAPTPTGGAPRVNVPRGGGGAVVPPAVRDMEAQIRAYHPDLSDEQVREAAVRAARRATQEED